MEMLPKGRKKGVWTDKLCDITIIVPVKIVLTKEKMQKS